MHSISAGIRLEEAVDYGDKFAHAHGKGRTQGRPMLAGNDTFRHLHYVACTKAGYQLSGGTTAQPRRLWTMDG